jgi:hypothetical protein
MALTWRIAMLIHEVLEQKTVRPMVHVRAETATDVDAVIRIIEKDAATAAEEVAGSALSEAPSTSWFDRRRVEWLLRVFQQLMTVCLT